MDTLFVSNNATVAKNISSGSRHNANSDGDIRHNWTQPEIESLLALPFPDLLFQAQTIHRRYFDPSSVQVATLLSIKTGGCPEDCGYCPQSALHSSTVPATKVMSLDDVLSAARAAKAGGATRFCMGAAWRSPKDRDIEAVCRMLEGVRELGLETCATLGMLTRDQAVRLACAGLDFYNHNLDSSPEFYKSIISTRTYRDRLSTLDHIREAGINVCCGGIVGLGESEYDQAALIVQLATLPVHPESVPINMLVRVAGTPLENAEEVDPLRFVRIVATARIAMPRSVIRLAAGREAMSDETHALCFLAGASSLFLGEQLLTTPNPSKHRDYSLLARLGMRIAATNRTKNKRTHV
jgi:biotin synthase